MELESFNTGKWWKRMDVTLQARAFINEFAVPGIPEGQMSVSKFLFWRWIHIIRNPEITENIRAKVFWKGSGENLFCMKGFPQKHQ